MREAESQFRKAVNACADLSLQDGLKAVAPADKTKIFPAAPRSVTGSANIDEDLRERFPQDNRWDYAVGYKGNDAKEKVYFIEVHPAETGEISCVVQKAKALKKWAESAAPDLWNMTVPREIHWVASGRCGIRLNDAYRRQLALAGLGSPKQRLILT